MNPGAGFSGSNLFIYCGNDPVNKSDSSGCNFIEDVKNWVTQAANDTKNWIVKAYSDTGDVITRAARQSSEAYFRSKQIEMETYQSIGKSIGDSFMSSMTSLGEAQIANSEAQMEASRAVTGFIEDRFSTPEKASNSLSAVGYAIDAAAAYLLAVGAGLIPSGIGAAAAMSAAAILGLASLPFHGASIIIDIANEE